VDPLTPIAEHVKLQWLEDDPQGVTDGGLDRGGGDGDKAESE
jgi:hypothetical protein